LNKRSVKRVGRNLAFQNIIYFLFSYLNIKCHKLRDALLIPLRYIQN